MNLLLAASGGDDGFSAPSIAEFFPQPFAFTGSVFEMNRVVFVRLVTVVIVVVGLGLAARRARLVPGRGQNLVEIGLDFVRVGVAEEILGKADARRYVPMLTTVFFAILAFNITGVVPLLNIAGTSVVGMPLVLALWVYVMYLGAGVRRHGLGGYLKGSLFPPGLPWPLYFLMTPIEILQVFVLRPATLTIRLLANMIAGHLMLVLTFSATNFLLFKATATLKAAGALTLAAGLVFTLFEVLVAVLQAYVFTVLAASYINMSLEEEH
jgi:F-type H+-transporting ATPase subunit a